MSSNYNVLTINKLLVEVSQLADKVTCVNCKCEGSSLQPRCQQTHCEDVHTDCLWCKVNRCKNWKNVSPAFAAVVKFVDCASSQAQLLTAVSPLQILQLQEKSNRGNIIDSSLALSHNKVNDTKLNSKTTIGLKVNKLIRRKSSNKSKRGLNSDATKNALKEISKLPPENLKLKIIPVEDINRQNKSIVNRWLNDDKNIFDRISQTQLSSNLLTNENLQMKTNKCAKKNLKHIGKMPTNANSEECENYNIEQVDSQKEIIRLQTPINDVIKEKTDGKCKTENLRQNLKRTCNSTSCSKSDWSRLKEIEKSTTKGKRKPRKLKVSTVPLKIKKNESTGKRKSQKSSIIKKNNQETIVLLEDHLLTENCNNKLIINQSADLFKSDDKGSNDHVCTKPVEFVEEAGTSDQNELFAKLQTKVQCGNQILENANNFINHTDDTCTVNSYILFKAKVEDTLDNIQDVLKCIQTLLQNLYGLFLNEQLKPKNTEERVCNDSYILNATTHTSSLSIYKNSAAVQTDKNETRGFRISSAESFRPRIYIERGIQTDNVVCHVCKCGSNSQECGEQSIINPDVNSKTLKISENKENLQCKESYMNSELKNIEQHNNDNLEVTKSSPRKPLTPTTRTLFCNSMEKDNSEMSPKSTSSDSLHQKHKKTSVIRKLIYDEKNIAKIQNKRTREHSDSESESESELNNKSKKICNLVDMPAEHNLLRTLNQKNSTQSLVLNSCSNEYKDPFQNVTKMSDYTSALSAPVAKMNTQDLIEKCDAIVRAVTKERYDEYVRSESRKDENPELPQLLGNTESTTNATKSLMQEIDIDDNLINNTSNVEIEKSNEKSLSPANLNILIDAFDDHLNTSFVQGTEEMNSLTENDITVIEKGAKVLINQDLPNIKVFPDNISTNFEQFEEIINDSIGESDEEIFNEDDEIVDVTPQKPKRSNIPSLTLEQSHVLVGMTPTLDDVIYLNETLAPPPEFQDNDYETVEDANNKNISYTLMDSQTTKHESSAVTEDTIEQYEMIMINNSLKEVPNASLTPDFIIFPDERKQSVSDIKMWTVQTSTPNTKLQTKKSCLSTVKSLDISPIHNKTKVTTISRDQSQTSETSGIISQKQKSILSYVKSPYGVDSTLVDDNLSIATKKLNKKPCVACTRLSKNQVLGITALCNKNFITFSNVFNKSVTHMIVSANVKGYVNDHTVKYVSAIAARIWVLNHTWIEECLKQGCLVAEEPYEVIDVSGIMGSRISRLAGKSNLLLKNYKIFTATPFASTTQQEINDIVTMVGGQIVNQASDLLLKDDSICLIITEARATQDNDFYDHWLKELRVLTVDIEWLTRSVGQYQVLSLKPFLLCSDDLLVDLEYPEHLLEDIPYSFSQNTTDS